MNRRTFATSSVSDFRDFSRGAETVRAMALAARKAHKAAPPEVLAARVAMRLWSRCCDRYGVDRFDVPTFAVLYPFQWKAIKATMAHCGGSIPFERPIAGS